MHVGRNGWASALGSRQLYMRKDSNGLTIFVSFTSTYCIGEVFVGLRDGGVSQQLGMSRRQGLRPNRPPLYHIAHTITHPATQIHKKKKSKPGLTPPKKFLPVPRALSRASWLAMALHVSAVEPGTCAEIWFFVFGCGKILWAYG